MKKKWIYCLLIMACFMFGLTACNSTSGSGVPEFSESGYTYDLNAGGDLSAGLKLNGGTLESISIDESVLAAEGYSYAEETLVIKADSLAQLSVGEHTLKATASGGSGTAKLEVKCIPANPVFSEESFTYDISKNGDLAVTVDIKGASLTKVMLDETLVDTEAYMYDAGALTISEKVFLGISVGDHTITVTTSKGEGSIVLHVVRSSSAPVFAYEEYVYDLYVGGELDMSLALNNGNLVYVQIDDEYLQEGSYSYADGALRFAEEYIVALQKGEFEVTVITDEGSDSALLKVINTIETSFDENNSREYTFGKDADVRFEADFDDVTIKRVEREGAVVDPAAYSYEDGQFILNKEILDRCYNEMAFKVYLSNNDSYDFSITTNVIFYTDYDVTTIHSDIQSNVGHNSLYQYTDNVSIVEAPADSGMEGKVLQFTPNTVDVAYGCHGIYTMRKSTTSTMWYDPGFAAGYYYAVSFDYMTEGTSVGKFCYSDGNGAWEDPLLLGPDNDGIVHHYSTILSYEELGPGVLLVAFFEGGGGKVYVDNMTVTRLDGKPVVAEGEPYSLGGGSYSLDFDSLGNTFQLYYEDALIEDVTYDSEKHKMTLPETFMMNLAVGTHTIKIVYPFAEDVFEISVVDNRVSEFVTTEGKYVRDVTGDLKMYGTFDETLEVVSLKQHQKSYNSGYGDWEFVITDTSIDLADQVELVTGQDNSGYLLLPAEFLNKFYGTTTFTVTFSNGKSSDINITTNAVMVDNKDESHIEGKRIATGGIDMGSPLNCGLWNGNPVVKDDGTGNHALYVTDTTGNVQMPTIYTVKIHTHSNLWYQAECREGYLYRIVFDYKLTGFTENSVYVGIYSHVGEDKSANFFGDGYDVTNLSPEIDEVSWCLNADGQMHSFDSGWFTSTSPVRMAYIYLNSFSAAEGKEVMVDNYAILESEDPLADAPKSYVKDQTEEFAFDLNEYEFISMTIDGQETAAEVQEGKVIVSKEALNNLSEGDHVLAVKTNVGIFKAFFNVTIGGSQAV